MTLDLAKINLLYFVLGAIISMFITAGIASCPEPAHNTKNVNPSSI